MKKCPFCAEEILDEAKVCKHCGREVAEASVLKKKRGCGTLLAIGIGGFFVLAIIGSFLGDDSTPAGPGPSRLTAEHHAAVDAAFADQGLKPTSLELSSAGYVVADFTLTDQQARNMPVAFKTYGEQRLMILREALLPFGLTRFRVNLNGTPPGTGLVRRYGSSRFGGSGSVDWLTP